MQRCVKKFVCKNYEKYKSIFVRILAPTKLRYEMPDDAEKLGQIVLSVPSNWCWVNGYLKAPRALYEKGEIAQNMKLILSRFHSIQPMYQSIEDYPYEEQSLHTGRSSYVDSSLLDIVLEKRWPSSVVFDEAAFETRKITIDMINRIINKFLILGYKGSASYYSGYRANSPFKNPERFAFTHIRNEIELHWDEKYDGKQENLKPIVTQLEKLNSRLISTSQE